jgi:hypothetical protein
MLFIHVYCQERLIVSRTDSWEVATCRGEKPEGSSRCTPAFRLRLMAGKATKTAPTTAGRCVSLIASIETLSRSSIVAVQDYHGTSVHKQAVRQK